MTPGIVDMTVAIGSPEIPSTPQLPHRFTAPETIWEFLRRRSIFPTGAQVENDIRKRTTLSSLPSISEFASKASLIRLLCVADAQVKIDRYISFSFWACTPPDSRRIDARHGMSIPLAVMSETSALKSGSTSGASVMSKPLKTMFPIRTVRVDSMKLSSVAS